MREIILDTETTGLKPADGHRIVEIGCIELLNCIPTGREWHAYVNPERDMPEEAFRVHGLSADFLADKPLFPDICDELVEFVEGAKLIMHNAPFDFAFLNAEFERCKRMLLAWENVVDSLALARRRHPGSPVSLDALCKRYGVDLSARDKHHGALVDCKLLASVYVELVGGHQARLELAVSGGEESPIGGFTPVATARPAPLPSRLSAAEATDHAKFVDGLSGAIWNTL